MLTIMQWLIYNGKKQKAMDILVKYHANGDVNDELVKYEFDEICLAIKLEEESQKCSYVDFIKTPANRRRLLVLLTMATGTVGLD